MKPTAIKFDIFPLDGGDYELHILTERRGNRYTTTAQIYDAVFGEAEFTHREESRTLSAAMLKHMDMVSMYAVSV